jgi:putative endonuclease
VRGSGPRHQCKWAISFTCSPANATVHSNTGVTNDLTRRASEHRDKQAPGFTKKYGVDILVWYEIHENIATAIEREKQIKGWNRAWKVRLIEKDNSGWNDLGRGLT